MDEYSGRVRAEIAKDDRLRKFIYVTFALVTLFGVVPRSCGCGQLFWAWGRFWS